jgi:DNA-binding MarR family transcriptional regulator
MRALWELDHAVFSASKRMKASLGVTGPERLAIRIIGELPGIAPGELAQVMHLDPSTLTKLLQRLVRRRLLVRHADAADRRRSELRLAAGGAAIDGLRSQTIESGVAAALDAIPPRDVGTAVTVLGVLSRALNALTFATPRPRTRSAAAPPPASAKRTRSAPARPAPVPGSRARR